MNLVNLLATIIYFVVFVEAFIALTMYIGVTIYRFFKTSGFFKKPQSTADPKE